MNKLEQIHSESKDIEVYTSNYFDYLYSLLKALDKKAIKEVLEEFQRTRKNGGRVYFIGNGGSAATSLHFAQDLEKGTVVDGKPRFQTESLSGNIPYITAIANDSSFENVFVDQLKAKLNEKDLLVGISASGNSPNLVKAFEFAKAKKAKTIALVGFDGGKIGEMADVAVHVKTAKGEYGPVEDIHMILDHVITTFLFLSEKNQKR